MAKLLSFMITPGGLTGAPRRLLTLAAALRARNVDVCIGAPKTSELLKAAHDEGNATENVEPAGILRLRQGALFGGGWIFRLRMLLDLIRQNFRAWRCILRTDADVVWIRGSKGIAFGALGTVLARRPLIWDVDYEPPSSGLVRWLHRLGLRAADKVVFQYAAAPDAIFGTELARFYRAKFKAIIPGIDLASLERFFEQRRGGATLPDDPFVILQVGTICSRKNQSLILEALRSFATEESGRAWELWLAYDEILEPKFRQQLRDHGLEKNVKLLGWRDDVKELMTQSSVLVMPSKDEGVPNAVQEAMAIGVPVLVSQAGGMPEIVSDGETGWVIDIEQPAQWAERLLWCRTNRESCEAVGRNAAAYAFQNFGTGNWGVEYARVVEQLVERRATRISY